MVVLHRVCHIAHITLYIYIYNHSEMDSTQECQAHNLETIVSRSKSVTVQGDHDGTYTPHVFAFQTNNKTDRREQASRTSDGRRPSFCAAEKTHWLPSTPNERKAWMPASD